MTARTRALLLGLALVVVVGLAIAVEFAAQGPVLFDASWLLAHEGWRTPGGVSTVRLLSDASGHVVMIPLCFVLAFAFGRLDRRAGVFFAASVGGSALLNEAIKPFFERPRPTVVERVYEPHGLSFPSGHSQASMAFALTILLVISRLRPRWRARAAALLLFPLFIGWTRTYLGVHYPSDVLAGFGLAALWVLALDAWHVRVAPSGPWSRTRSE